MSQRDQNKTTSLWYFFGLAVFFMLIFIYEPSFRGPPLFDDMPGVFENYALRNLSTLSDIWAFCPQRFLSSLSFALNFATTGTDTYFFHITNLVIHIFTCLFLFGFLFSLQFSPRLSPNLKAVPYHWVAAVSAAIFALHPQNSQAVAYIWQRNSSLCGMFYAAALCYYALALTKSRNAKYFLLSWTAAISSMFCKENSFTLPFALFLTELFFAGLAPWSFDQWKRFFLERSSWMIFGMLLCVIPLTMYFFDSLPLQHIQSIDKTSKLLWWQYALTQTYVIPKYVFMFFVPLNFTLDYDIIPVRSLGDVSVFPILALLGAVFGAWWVRKRCPLITFGITLFLLCHAVESSFVPLEDLMFDHRSYIPNFGMSVFLVGVLVELKIPMKVWGAIAFAICFGLGFLTRERAKIWGSHDAIYWEASKRSPLKARPIASLADIALAEGRYEDAKTLYQKAIELQPDYWKFYNNLGAAEMDSRGNHRLAKEYFTKAQNLNKWNNPQPLINLGNLASDEQNWKEAASYYQQACALGITDGLAQYRYIELLVNQGQLIEAQIFLQKQDSQKLYSTPDGATAIALFQASAREYDRALMAIDQAIFLNPKQSFFHRMRGKILYALKRTQEAKDAFRKAMSLSPHGDPESEQVLRKLEGGG